MTEDRLPLAELLAKAGDGDFLRSVAEAVVQLLMETDVDGLIGAGRHERTGERTTYRNGYRDRTLDTRLGSLQLRIPKLRQGSYFPPFLEPRKTSEKALVAMIQEAWVGGVSTRRVDDLVQAMGLSGIGKEHSQQAVQGYRPRQRLPRPPLAGYVKPYVKRGKTDAADAEAICEAVTRPTMRFVPVKTIEQQAVLMLHKTRDLLIKQRISPSILTALVRTPLRTGAGVAVEIITGVERRRHWRLDEKLRIVAEVEQPGACFAEVARRHDVSRGLLWNWRRQVRSGALALPCRTRVPSTLFDVDDRLQRLSDLGDQLETSPRRRCENEPPRH